MKDMGARPKAVVFTESRRTQLFLKDFLEANGHAGEVLTFNGTNREPVNGAHGALARNARHRQSRCGCTQCHPRCLQERAQHLIATEAAAEGLNLQFCSLVINYDLPWNPQRIEQRIGRCHRFGQEFDVVVINFLNARNEADQRVYELLDHKFNLFNGVFAPATVLGSIGGRRLRAPRAGHLPELPDTEEYPTCLRRPAQGCGRTASPAAWPAPRNCWWSTSMRMCMPASKLDSATRPAAPL
ncbi:MAG: helicase-related protein [Flavobacteriales bacterium]